jgi:hypothetical protein
MSKCFYILLGSLAFSAILHIIAQFSALSQNVSFLTGIITRQTWLSRQGKTTHFQPEIINHYNEQIASTRKSNPHRARYSAVMLSSTPTTPEIAPTAQHPFQHVLTIVQTDDPTPYFPTPQSNPIPSRSGCQRQG